MSSMGGREARASSVLVAHELDALRFPIPLHGFRMTSGVVMLLDLGRGMGLDLGMLGGSPSIFWWCGGNGGLLSKGSLSAADATGPVWGHLDALDRSGCEQGARRDGRMDGAIQAAWKMASF